jgi:hypothetical protein
VKNNAGARSIRRTGLREIRTAEKLFLLLTIIFVIGTCYGAGQTSGGTITGTVVDPAGAVVNGAQVEVVNTATNASENLTTEGAGLFNVPNVNPGTYLVTVTAPGFAREQVTALVEISKITVLKIQLQVGTTGESVTVSNTSPVVDLDSSSLNQAVDGKTIRELPLNGRDWTQLSVLEPNVHTVDNQLSISAGDNSRSNRGVGNQISIGGTRPQQNVYRLDGIITNDYSGGGPGGALGGTLGVDAIQEFSVMTSNSTADYGRTSGGTISAVTRSGTNVFHGSAYEFIRNSALDAKNYFSNGVLAPFKRNQFGGTVGGPILKNKLFFFFNYEGLRQSRTTSVTDTVPSANARAGLLACAQPATGTQNKTCLTSAGGSQAPPGTTGVQQIKIDPKVQPYLQFYPVPNGQVAGDTGSWSFNSKAVSQEDLFTGRADYTISQKDSIHGSALSDSSADTQPDSYNFVVTGLQPDRKLYTIGETHTFSPNIINFARFGYAYTFTVAPASSTAINPLAADTSYGFTPGATVGNLQISGLTPFFGGVNVEGVYSYHYNSYQVGDDVYITKGKHSIQTGFSIELIQSNNRGTTTAGFYAFGSLQSFLTNQPQSFTSSVPGANTPIYMRQKVYGVYIRDDYHFRPNLTFNLGVRYEPTSGVTEKNGHFSVLPTPTAGTPLLGSKLFNNPTLKNISPRVGLAWDPFGNGKTSVRAGYGIYDTLPLTYMFNLSTLNVFPYSVTASLTNTATLAGTFPKQSFPLAVAANSNKYAFIDQNPGRSYVHQYILDVQQQILDGTSLEVGYIGSHGVRQPLKSNDGNIVEPTNPNDLWHLQWPLATTTTTTTAAGAVTTKTVFSGTKINPNSNVGQTDTTYWNESTVYNAFIAALRRNIGSLRLGVSYTWSKALDESSSSNGGTNFVNSIIAPYPREIGRFRGLADFNVAQNLSVSVLYTMPGPKEGTVKKLFGAGYQFGTIVRSSTGLPFTPLITGDQLGLQSASVFSFPDRNYTGGPNCNENPVNLADKFNYLRRECFSFPQGITVSQSSSTGANGTVTSVRTYYPTLGNVQRNSIIAQGINNVDLSLVKNTAIPRVRESFRVEFRAEAFNLFNHPMFQVPSRASLAIFNATGAPVTSQILTATSAPERQIQFGLKLIF